MGKSLLTKKLCFYVCRTASFPLIVKGELAVVSITHNVKTKHTKLVLGKSTELRRGMKLTDPKLWPLNMIETFNGV